MTSHAKVWANGLLKYGIGLGVLAWVVAAHWDADPAAQTPGLRDMLRGRVEPLALVGAGVLLTFAVGVQILRWHLLVRALDVPLSLHQAARVGLVGVFYNLFLPGAVGGDVIRAYVVARDSPGRRAAAVASVGADRLIGLFGLVLYTAVIGGACWFAGDERITGNEYLRFIVRASAGVVAVAAVGWVLLGVLGDGFGAAVERLLGKLPKLGRPLTGLWRATRLYRERGRAIAGAIALTALAQGGLVGGFDLAARSFPPPDPQAIGSPAEHFVIVPVGCIAQVLFPAPGGVGGGEAAYGWLYREVLRKPAATGIAASLGVRLVFSIIGVIGYLVYLRMRTELPADVSTPPADPPPAPPRRRRWLRFPVGRR